MPKRIFLIDLMRFVAITLMVFFHLAYDLNQFHYISVRFGSPFWFWLPRVIVLLFLLCVGMSLSVVHNPEFKPRKYWSRLAKVLAGALIISVSTYFMFPEQWVYSGTLHCIAATTLMALPFIKRPRLSLVLGILILASMYFTGINFVNVGEVLHSKFTDFIPARIMDFFPAKSMDFIPVYPWFAFVLLGIYLKTFKLEKFDIAESRFKSVIKWISSKSLYIYLIHQPLMFSVTYLVYKISH